MEFPTVWRDTGGLQGFTVSRFLKQIYLYQHMVVPAWWFQVDGDGEGYLNIMANGGVGDVDVYVRFDEYPTWVQKRQLDPIRTFETLRKRIYDMRSATPGNQEQIIIERPQQGRSLPLSFNMLLLLSSCHFKLSFQHNFTSALSSLPAGTILSFTDMKTTGTWVSKQNRDNKRERKCSLF